MCMRMRCILRSHLNLSYHPAVIFRAVSIIPLAGSRVSQGPKENVCYRECDFCCENGKSIVNKGITQKKEASKMRRTIKRKEFDSYIKNLHTIQARIVKEYFGNKKPSSSGRIYRICIFHGEKTPSLVFNVKKRMFHCFGCGIGGNTFTFMGKMTGLRGYELMRYIEKKYNYPMPGFKKVDKEVNPPKKQNRLEFKLTPEQKFLRKVNLLFWKASQEKTPLELLYSYEANAIMQLFYQ